MRCRVLRAQVGFDFDDSADEELAALLPHKNFAEQIRPNQAGVAVVEGAREKLEVHPAVVARGHSPRSCEVRFMGALRRPPPHNLNEADPMFYAAPFCASFNQFSTSSACPSGFTFLKICLILPSGPMMNVVRATPITFLPYMFFS